MSAESVAAAAGTAPPSLFSVLGGAVTRAALAQAQRDVDTLCLVSAALASSSPATRAASAPAGVQANSSTQRLLLVVEGLGSAGPARGEADSNSSRSRSALGDAGRGVEEREAMPSVLAAAAGQGVARSALINAFGVAEGSALYRECVQAPRRRLHRLVRQLAATVRTRCPPAPAGQWGELHDGDAAALDVHVQLYPSSAAVHRCAVPDPLRAAQGFCAAVTVRRLSALQAEAAAEQELRTRYMRVAALGQTLTTALDFWADVSYGDTPPAALLHYPPLGFEEADRAERQLGRRAPRHDGHAVADEGAAPPALVLGMSGALDASAQALTATAAVASAQPPAWVQPLCLTHSSTSDGLTERQRAAGATPSSPSRLAPLLPLHYDAVGLLAVVYVHGSGMAYVGFPSVTGAGSADAEASSAAPAHEVSPVATMATAEAVARTAPVCVLPMRTTTGFVRSLLGLT